MTENISRLATALAERYVIEREIGSGGMARVYLAHDLKHDRGVAVKVLRPELASILGADRFLKEIAVTANLQHPNILPLYDSGEADTFLYYVMPFIEGETLRDRLDREKQLSVADTIKIVESVAAALQYAHDRGIVHRDIKPENILLQAGQALVADFGIALAVTQAGGTRLTETGLSLGTPHYMSPEQVAADRGIDARSDIYSLAAMTYEMLVGEPPHTGPSAQAIVAKIITDEPRRITLARNTVPEYVEFAVFRALSKLPVDRYPSVTEFANALAEPAASNWSGFIPALAKSRGLRRWATSILVAFLAVAAGWNWVRSRFDPEAAVVRFEISYPGSESFGTSRKSVAVSPDGSLIVFVGQGVGNPQLYIRPMDNLESVVLPGTDGASEPFFSPDGNTLGYSTVVGLMKVPVTGGAPTTILKVSEPRSATWGEDDKILFGSSGGLWRVSPEGGDAERITQLDSVAGDRLHGDPQLLPGGNILFTITRADAEEVFVAVLSARTGKVTTLFRGLSPRYARTGNLLYGRTDGELMGVPFDPAKAKVAGPAVRLIAGIAGSAGMLDYGFSNSGALAYRTGSTIRSTVVMVDRDGNESPLLGIENSYFSPKFSPDGGRIVLGVGEVPTRQIWIFETEDRTFTPLTFDGQNYYPVWSADGQRVVFTTETSDNIADLRWIYSDGTGQANLLLSTGALNYPESWSRDGQYLVYREQDASTQSDIWVLPLDTQRTRRRLFDFPSREDAPRISPDGRWLAFASDLSGEYEVYVTSFPQPGPRTRVSLEGGTEPIWANDGGELFYRAGTSLMAATVQIFPEFKVLERSGLFEDKFERWPYHSNYDVHPDGQRFVFIKGHRGSQNRLVVILNFPNEMERLMGEGL